MARQKIADKTLDDLCRAIVFARDQNKCRRCGSRHALQWSHIHSKRFKAVKWDPRNSKALCAKCHFWWHDHPTLAGEWVKTEFAEADLKAVNNLIQPPDGSPIPKVDREAVKHELTRLTDWIGRGGDPRTLPGGKP